MPSRILVTGGAGFIGSAVVRRILRERADQVLVVDKLTYAGRLASLRAHEGDVRYGFRRLDIADADAMRQVFAEFSPDLVIHLAAESHVDRSIDAPAEFIRTNVVGTYALLQAALEHWRALPADRRTRFRFLHVSTDEVFGSLGGEGAFDEATAYDPRSPYSASKASSDHFVRAWHHTYGLPTIVTNCSNNYGPFQFPEKLIPLAILNAAEGRAVPVYGAGENVRDWLHVDDHAAALLLVAERGRPGATYAVGGRSERRNLDVVRALCDLLDEFLPDRRLGCRRDLIAFVADRPGHDLRYAIDAAKIERELGWVPAETFESGLRKTVIWYLENRDWWEPIRAVQYQGERLGLSAESHGAQTAGAGRS